MHFLSKNRHMNALPTKWPLLDYILEEFSLELLLWLQKSIPGTRPSTQIDSVLLDLEFSSAVLSLAVTSVSWQKQAKVLVEHCITESQEVSWTLAILLGKGCKNNWAYRYKYNYDIPPKWLQTQIMTQCWIQFQNAATILRHIWWWS